MPNTNCTPVCTAPTFSAIATPVSCVNGVLQIDGKICISNVSANATKAGYSEGTVYSGPSYAAANNLPTGGCLVTNLPNPSVAKQYVIRVYASADCYNDVVVTLLPNTNCTPVCTAPTFSASATTVSCVNGVLQLDGKICISNVSANATKAGYSEGTVYSGPSYAAANNLPIGGCLVTNLPNPNVAKQYVVRVYASADCYNDVVVTLLPNTNCTPVCTAPTFSASATTVSCVNGVLQVDGKICISNVSANATKAGYSEGTVYSGPSYAVANNLPTGGCLVTNLPNPSVAKQYVIRVFASADCYNDVVVTLLPNTNCTPVCTAPTYSASATTVSCVNGVLQVDGKICISNVSANATKAGYSEGTVYSGQVMQQRIIYQQVDVW
ncbi:MAG: hypothetical protein IPL95_10380 [Saprospiraceae bacterium]|nr:hypothetical protein [Saprospiraceae bacterium]